MWKPMLRKKNTRALIHGLSIAYKTEKKHKDQIRKQTLGIQSFDKAWSATIRCFLVVNMETEALIAVIQ